MAPQPPRNDVAAGDWVSVLGHNGMARRLLLNEGRAIERLPTHARARSRSHRNSVNTLIFDKWDNSHLNNLVMYTSEAFSPFIGYDTLADRRARNVGGQIVRTRTQPQRHSLVEGRL